MLTVMETAHNTLCFADGEMFDYCPAKNTGEVVLQEGTRVIG